MALRKVIDNALSIAFKQMQDLAIVALFAKAVNGVFDFSTAQIVGEDESTKRLKIVVIKSKKAGDSGVVVSKDIMFQTSLIDVSAYDTVTFDGVSWKIGPVISNNGFVTTLTIFKET